MYEECARAAAGSSPLTRGKLGVGLSAERVVGLIPAHAGKTMHSTYPDAHYRAHPRSRGENRPEGARFPFAKGSSPLTRGKLLPSTLAIGALGLIPAHAGKTWTPPLLCVEFGAHPRSRGEN